MATLRSRWQLLALLTVLSVTFGSGFLARAQQPAQLGPVPSDDDFATQVLADPWDMSGREDIAFERSRDTGNVRDLRFEDGLLVATSTTGDPRLSLQVPSDPFTNPVPGEGGYQPINADLYRYLTVRLFVPPLDPQTTFDGVQVFWQTAFEALALGSSDILTVGRYTKGGWNTFTIDLKSQASSGNIPGTSAPWRPWQGQVPGLYIDPTLRSGVEFKIDFVRLSANPPSIPITLDGGSGDLFIRPAGGSEADNELITTGFAGQFSWNVGLAAGSYEIFAGNARDTLTVDATPVLTITAPSFISGAEFASRVRSLGWNMDSADEIDGISGVSSSSFANSILSATSSDFGTSLPCGNTFCGDPQVTLHLDPNRRVNVERYKYLTIRMRIDGELNTDDGSVARLIWTSTTFDEATTTFSWVTYEGWQIVSFELTNLLLEAGGTPWDQSRPSALRLDPHEFPQPRQFEVDYVMLTGPDRADTRFDIRFLTSDAEGSPLTTQFFYTPTAGATTGGSPITCLDSSNTVPANQLGLFLPLISVLGPTRPLSAEGATCRWDTSQVPDGTYYIYGVAGDGRNSHTLASSTPLIVAH